jgi:hypothetical protein
MEEAKKNVGVKIFLASLRFFVHASHGKTRDLTFFGFCFFLFSFFYFGFDFDFDFDFGFLFLIFFRSQLFYFVPIYRVRPEQTKKIGTRE